MSKKLMKVLVTLATVVMIASCTATSDENTNVLNTVTNEAVYYENASLSLSKLVAETYLIEHETINDWENYVMSSRNWGADVMKMTAGATFPTDLRYDAPKITTLSDMKYVCSNFGNFPITFTDGIATAEIVYSLENATWGQEQLGEIQFGVCIDESWSEKFTGATIYSFNTEATLTRGANENNMVHLDILTDGMTYVLTIDANAGTVKITAKE